MTLAYRPSHVSQKNQKVSPRRKECQAPSISLRSLRLGEIRFFPSEWSTPSQRIRAYYLESPESLPSENFLFSSQSGGSARWPATRSLPTRPDREGREQFDSPDLRLAGKPHPERRSSLSLVW